MNQTPLFHSTDIFACTRCGFCCHGETTVSLDEQDQERMIKTLGISRKEMQTKYWRINGNIVQMQVKDGHCIFYDKNTGCSVHAGRPWRCRQWPLHPSMLADENNYTAITASCPGFKPHLDYQQFRRIFQSLLQENTTGKHG